MGRTNPQNSYIPKKIRLSRAELRNIIVDRRLYGPAFFSRSGPLLFLGITILATVYWALNSPLLMVYVPLMIIYVLTSAILTKNTGLEFTTVNYPMGFVFLLAS